MPAPRPAKLDKGLAHFNRLKRSVEEVSPLLAGDIQLFLRVLKTDASNWYCFINSFDLLQPVVVDGDTVSLLNVAPGVLSVRRLSPIPNGKRRTLNLDGLLALKILSVDSDEFTLKTLLNAVAYSGDVHPQADPSKSELHLIKQRVLDVVPDFIGALIRDLGEVLVTSFEDVFAPWRGRSDLSSPEHHRQPRLVLNGRICANQFENSYSQCGLHANPGKGVRLLADYRSIVHSSSGTVLALGHRSDDTLRLRVVRQGDRLVFQVGNTDAPNLSVTIGQAMLSNEFHWFEVCTYPDGTVVTAIDGFKCGVGVISRADIRSNCKLIVGSDLDGKSGASFQQRELLIDFVATNGVLKEGPRFGSRRLSYPVPLLVDNPNILRRWTPPNYT